MKKIEFDKNHVHMSAYALIVIMAAILFEKIISNLQPLSAALESFVKTAGSILSPFVYALFIAFFLNPFARWMQRKLFDGYNISEKIKRAASSMIAIIMFVAIIVIITAFVLPELLVSLYSLVTSLPEVIENVERSITLFIASYSEKYGFIPPDFLESALSPLFENVGSLTQIAGKVVTGTLSFGRGVFNFAIGLIIAFYMMIYKDGFKAYWVKLIYAFMKPERAERFIKNCARVNNIFEGFFVGKTLDSAIIGILSFVIMTFLIKPKYILLSSVIIGVTNMIPFFGPFIGGVPVVILALFYDVKLGLMMTIFIFLLQQFDGYILGPKILGDSTGLSPFWVIASILVGGATMGLIGMFLGVPTFAAIKMFADEAVERRFFEKYGRVRQ